ncbi:MAG: hypothetical protein NTU54_03080 [Candidatus Omnitrophica bacterium]|nr:hypothetical protein [Candidatus Omnitrophota bacterium]
MLVEKKNICLVLLMAFILSACSLQQTTAINITDIKTAKGIDEKLMPLGVTGVFPDGTQKVFCWFQWKNTEVNTTVMARWYFVTDNIHILDYNFTIPRKEGSGSVSLTMPEGKKLPVGQYRIDLNFGKQTLKSTIFKVQ